MTWMSTSTSTHSRFASRHRHGWRSTASGGNVGAVGPGSRLNTNAAVIALRGTPGCGETISAGTGARFGAKYWNTIPIRAGSAAGAGTGTMSHWTLTTSCPSHSVGMSGTMATYRCCAAPATRPRPCWTTGYSWHGAGLTGTVPLWNGLDNVTWMHSWNGFCAILAFKRHLIGIRHNTSLARR